MKTKIICTIGPACSSEDGLKELIRAGMSVARVNCSHGSVEENEETIERIKKVRREMNVPLAIMLDTKGPDIRIGHFEGGGAEVKSGQTFTLTTRPTVGFENKVHVDFKRLPKFLKTGNVILLNDGLIKMTVMSVDETEILCRVNIGGRLTNRKNLFVPGVDLGLPFISKADELDLIMGTKADVDWIAASFVNCAKDVLNMKKLLNKYGNNIPVIAKIESTHGVENIDEILKVSEGIMVARGDLGVEYEIERIPTLQKMLIDKARRAGKLVVTATEMLESMIEKPRPTRAETTDVANSILDGTSCIMLSSETAVGKHPTVVVQYMKRIAEEAEKNYNTASHYADVAINNNKDAFARTITSASATAKAKAICAFTFTGSKAYRVSKYHPPCPIYAFAKEEKVFNQLSIVNDTTPVLCPRVLTVAQMLEISNNYILEQKIAQKDDIIIVNAAFQDSDTDVVLIHPVK